MSDFQNILSIILAENFKEDEVRGKYSTKMLNINKIIRIVKLKDVCKRKDADGRTILYSVIKYKLPLHVILAVLTQYPDICKETDNLKNLPIHFALDNCAPTEVLLEMLRIYPESCKVREMQGLLPLHFAAWSNVSIDVVRTMIEIYPQACSERENSSFTPFSLGVWNSCSVDTLKLMMSVHPKCCEEQNTFNGDFPLHLSAAESNDKVMQVLLQTYPEACQQRDFDGCLPIHILVYPHNLKISPQLFECLRMLSKAYPQSIYSTGHYNLNPVEIFSKVVYNTEALRILLNANPSVLTAPKLRDNLVLYHDLNWTSRKTAMRIFMSALSRRENRLSSRMNTYERYFRGRAQNTLVYIVQKLIDDFEDNREDLRIRGDISQNIITYL